MATGDGGVFRPRDYIGAAKDATLRRTLSTFKATHASSLPGAAAIEEEQVLFADELVKVNRMLVRQKRTIIVTSLSILNFKPGKYAAWQRQINVADVDALWVVAGTAELIVHMWEASAEYDYRFDAGTAGKRDEIMDAISFAYRGLYGRGLARETLDEVGIKRRMVTKTQVKEKNDPAAVAAVMERHSSILPPTARAARSPSASLRSQASIRNALAAAAVAPAEVAAAAAPPAAAAAAASSSSTAGPPAPPPPLPATPSAPPAPSAAVSGAEVRVAPPAPAGGDDVLVDAVYVAREVALECPDNDALSKALKVAEEDTTLGRARITAEVLVGANTSDVVFKSADRKPGNAHRLMKALGAGVIYSGDAEVRGWSTRALWRLCHTFKSSPLLRDDLKAAGGFDGLIIKGWAVPTTAASVGGPRATAAPVAHLESPVYRAIMEVILDALTRPSEPVQPVETFGKLVARPDELRLLFRLLPVSIDWQLRHDIMKDLNVLLVKREENFSRILEQPDWQAWLAPLLAALPKKATDRSEVQNEYLKYVVNFFTMHLQYVFQSSGAAGGDLDRQLNRFMEQLRMQCGWTDAVIGVARNLLASLAVKMSQNVARFKRRFDRPEWENLFKVATVVEDFIFYRPIADDGGGGGMSEIMAEKSGKAMVLHMPVNALAPTSAVAVAPINVDNVDKSHPGLHLNIVTGEADDLKLAQRVLAVFTEIGLTGDASTDPLIASTREKKSKDLLVHASGIMKIFKDIVGFLEDCNKQRLLGDDASKGEAAQNALIENLAKFLEKRQKSQRTGFLSRTTNKKGIVQALQTSVMRQKAQQTIRAQAQATVVKANAITIEAVDDDAHAPTSTGGAKPLGTTAKRLQGTRAAVEAAGTGPSRPPITSHSAASASAAAAAAARMSTPATTLTPTPEEAARAKRGSRAGMTTPLAFDTAIATAADAAIKRALASVTVDAHAPAAEEAAGVSGASAAGSSTPSIAEESAAAVEEEEEDVRVSDIICDRCSQPLLSDDGVAALDKTWHVNCFCCSECETPFRDDPYYERRGQAYCRADYLRIYGRSVCADCMEPLRVGDTAFSAAGRMYHPEHFCCEGCATHFEANAPVYEREGAPYCGKCNLSMFGSCAGCNDPISQDRPAVSALGRNWHLACITCSMCGSGFPDGVFFSHTDENGIAAAFCERDYLDMFAPKCRGCNEAVKDAGLHACGSSWHAACFVCMVCRTPFPEGGYFEVDGRPYCSNDYFAQYGTKCSGCDSYITDEMVNALGRAYHPGHFGCAKCKAPFADLEYYEKDGKAYDEMCYCELFCPVCPVCDRYVVEDGSAALGKTYHPWCLVCSNCGEQLTTTVHSSPDGKLFCEQDFLALCAAVCERCGGVIEEDSIRALDKTWHSWCFTCNAEGCDVNLASGNEFHVADGAAYCRDHFAAMKGELCAHCGTHIMPGEQLSVTKKFWHPACLQCFGCHRALTATDKIFSRNDSPHCESCFLAGADKCVACRQPLTGKYLTVLNRKYHAEGCLGCVSCAKLFTAGEKMYQKEGWPVCSDHARVPFTAEAQERIAAAAADVNAARAP